MIRRSWRICAVLLVILPVLLAASKPPQVEYAGTVVIKGNEPFTVPVLVTAYGEFVIDGPLRDTLQASRFQQRTVRLRGVVSAEVSTELPFTPIFIVHEIVDAGN